jgi:putative transposase
VDGNNRALNNITVERFWQTLKYEDIYIKDYHNMVELKEGLKNTLNFTMDKDSIKG